MCDPSWQQDVREWEQEEQISDIINKKHSINTMSL